MRLNLCGAGLVTVKHCGCGRLKTGHAVFTGPFGIRQTLAFAPFGTSGAKLTRISAGFSWPCLLSKSTRCFSTVMLFCACTLAHDRHMKSKALMSSCGFIVFLLAVPAGCGR